MKSTITAYCHVCQKPMPFKKDVPNHILHLILSMITGGFWLIIWLLVVLTAKKTAACSGCGCAQNL